MALVGHDLVARGEGRLRVAAASACQLLNYDDILVFISHGQFFCMIAWFTLRCILLMSPSGCFAHKRTAQALLMG